MSHHARVKAIIAASLLAASHRAMAAEGRATGSAARSPDPVDGVNALVTSPTPALLSTALNAKSTGTQLRASFVPLAALDLPYIEGLSELKVSALTDTKTNLTEPSVSISYNPFSLRGGRGRSIERDSLNFQCQAEDIVKQLTPAREQARHSEDAQKKQLDQIDRSNVANVMAYLDQKQMVDDAHAKVQDLSDQIVKAQAEEKDCEKKRVASEWRVINDSAVPLVTLTAFIDTYPFGKGPDPNDTTGQTSAKLEPWGGWGLQPAISFHFAERGAVDAYATIKNVRASGAPGTRLAKYWGAGLTASCLVVSFIGPERQWDSADYVQQGFIPGVAGGISAQYLNCKGREQCVDLKGTQWSATPFFDVRAKPELQVRFSVVLGRYSAVDKKGTDVAPAVSIGAQFSAL